MSFQGRSFLCNRKNYCNIFMISFIHTENTYMNDVLLLTVGIPEERILHVKNVTI